MYVSVSHVCNAHGVQKRVSDPLRPRLQTVEATMRVAVNQTHGAL